MKRILQYESLNAVLAIAFFAQWFLINLHHRFSGLPIEGVALVLFLGFFVASFLPFQKLALGKAIAFSVVSALVWTIATIFISLVILVGVFGVPGPCL
jgi:hypothetical protein